MKGAIAAALIMTAALFSSCAPLMRCSDTSGVDDEGHYTMIEVCTYKKCRDIKTGQFVRCQ